MSTTGSLGHVPGKEVRAEGETARPFKLRGERQAIESTSGTRTLTEPEDVDSTSSTSNPEKGAQHPEK